MMNKEEEKKKTHFGIANLERRRHPRFKINLPLEYYRVDSPFNQRGQTLNASEGGLEVYFPEKMEVGAHLNLKLFFTSGSEMNTIESLAEVVWMEILLGEAGEEYRTGVKFLNLSSEDMTKLKNFLISLSQ
jgi:c-di-GMP-binding flagellar brake protein YcgR